MERDLLLVDDDVGMLRFLESCARDIANLRVATNGADALRLARLRRPDLMVLDLHLGDTDGLTLLQALRQDATLAGVPVIFVSAEHEIAPQVRALDLDVMDWLTKPLDRQRLRARLEAALRRSDGATPGAFSAAEAAADGSLRGAKVLAVDDEPVVLEALRAALAPEGFRFMAAASAGEALALAAAETPEAVLIDMVLPGDDGFALARRLMTLPTMTDVPLIFVTQHGDAASEVRALRLGAYDFISKPVVPPVLRARVCNALRLRRRSMQAQRRADAGWRQIGGAQLAALVAHARDAIVTVDAQGCIVLANQAAHTLLGATDGPLIGAPLPAWLRSSLPDALLAGTLSRSAETHLDTDDGAKVVDVVATAFVQAEQRLVTLTFHDQTERLRAEALSRHQAELEAESRARALMLSYLAHEIGNPLNGIVGLTGLLLRSAADPLSSEQRHKLELVADSADVLCRLMGDALDLARWQAGRFSIELQSVALRAIIEPTLAALQDVAERAGVTLAEPTGDVGTLVRADPHRLRQCLHNLVSNACKYGRPGGHVQVDVVAGPAEVEIAVSDNGLGLSAAQLAHLFEPFERLGRTGPVGHGLGLAVTRMLAQAMGGRLEVTAQEGLGSRFTLTLAHEAGQEAQR